MCCTQLDNDGVALLERCCTRLMLPLLKWYSIIFLPFLAHVYIVGVNQFDCQVCSAFGILFTVIVFCMPDFLIFGACLLHYLWSQSTFFWLAIHLGLHNFLFASCLTLNDCHIFVDSCRVCYRFFSRYKSFLMSY